MKNINKITFIKHREKTKLEKELDYLNYIVREINLIFSEDSIPPYLDSYRHIISNFQELCKNRKTLEQKEYSKIKEEISKIKKDLNSYIEKLRDLNAIHFNFFRLDRWLNTDGYWIVLGTVSILSIICIIVSCFFI